MGIYFTYLQYFHLINRQDVLEKWVKSTNFTFFLKFDHDYLQFTRNITGEPKKNDWKRMLVEQDGVNILEVCP